MAAPRLPFLYPNFLRAVRACEPKTYSSLRRRGGVSAPCQQKLHTSRHPRQEAYSSRYGPAASQESLPPPPKPAGPVFPTEVPSSPEKDHKHDPYSNPAHQEIEPPIQSDGSETAYSGSDNAASADPAQNAENSESPDLDLVLSAPEEFSRRHPHLAASPYEHHFDTYSLVQQLGAQNAYTPDQAITLMKAIRHMLAINLVVAKESLVSKSDIENEAYLFRAACSELRTTLQAARRSEMLKQRSQRAQLIHECDLLSQKMTQDLSSMREELKGMFNDRKLGLAEEKRLLDGQIQDINYKITVLLNSEVKSNVEGLRWVLTRRAALAIGLSACMILAALNYSSIKIREREELERKRKQAKEQEKERLKWEEEQQQLHLLQQLELEESKIIAAQSQTRR